MLHGARRRSRTGGCMRKLYIPLSYMLWTGLGGNYMKGHRLRLNECYSDTTRAICDTHLCTEGATCVTPQSHQSVAHDLRNGVSGRQRHPYRVCVRRRARPLYSFISSTGVWGGRRSSMLSASAARRRSEARAALAACCSRRSSRTWLGSGQGHGFGPEIGQFGFAFGFAFGFGVGKGLMPAEARGQARGHLLLGGEHLEHVLRLCYPRVEHVLLLRQAGWR